MLIKFVRDFRCDKNANERGKASRRNLFGLQKAFDSVPHGRLLAKLELLGISGSVLKIIDDFLSDRWMAIRVGNQTSTWARVLLFLIFINDLPDTVISPKKMFADDVKLIGTAEKPAGNTS